MIGNSCVFLDYIFKRTFAWYICCINISQSKHKFHDEFLFFLTVSNNISLHILDKFLADEYVNY